MGEIVQKYGFFGYIKLIIYLIYTKLFYRSARIVRLPIDIRNKKNINFNKGLTTGIHCRIEAYPENPDSNKKIIEFGKDVQLNDYVHIVGINQVKIGDNVLMASKIFISDCNHGNYKGANQSSPLQPPSKRTLESAPVEIKKNVWLGESVCVMPGVTIGEGSVIGAMSVVTRDIPDFCIAVGSPAKVVKKYDFSTNKWMTI